MTNDEIKAQAIADVATILWPENPLVQADIIRSWEKHNDPDCEVKVALYAVAQREQNIRLELENERLRKEAERIACDYWPGSPKELGLALDEMRGAIGSLAQVQAAPEKAANENL